MIVLVLTLLVLVVGALAMWRNVAVYRLMRSINDAVYAATHSDIERGRPWEWRYIQWDTEGDYNRLMLRFWITPNRYRRQCRFIDPEATP